MTPTDQNKKNVLILAYLVVFSSLVTISGQEVERDDQTWDREAWLNTLRVKCKMRPRNAGSSKKKLHFRTFEFNDKPVLSIGLPDLVQ